MSTNWFKDLFTNEAKSALNSRPPVDGVGRVERIVLTHEYSPEGIVLIDQLTYARIADPIDPETIISATMMSGDKEITVTGDDIVVTSDAAEIATLTALGVKAGFVFYTDVTASDSGRFFQAGLYVLSTQQTYATRVEYENIYPIDPKFIPDDYAPKAIDLDTYGIGQAILEVLELSGGTKYVENVGSFWEDVDTDRPLVLKIAYNSGFQFSVSNVATLRNTTNGGIIQVAYSVLLYNVEDNSMYDTDTIIQYAGSNGGAYVIVKMN